MQAVDPEIVKLMKLPSGPSGPYIENMNSLDWEYAIVMDARIKEMELLVQSRHPPHELSSRMENFYREFRHAIGILNYMTGLFEKIFKTALPEHFNSQSVGKEFVKTMRSALDEDLKELGEFPSDRFASLQVYMEHETWKMADEMEMKSFNDFDRLRNLHSTYLDFKSNGRSHANAMERLKQSPQYWDMVMHLTLLDKIHKLETETNSVISSLLHRVETLEAANNKKHKKCA